MLNKKRGVIFLILIILFISISDVKSQSSNATTSTILQIGQNSNPPILSNSIPNQTIAKNTNLTKAFYLEDYFSDNETLSYDATSMENISIIITAETVNNITKNYVSFFPDYNFTGIRNVTFNASDGFSSVLSNIIYINVTEDTMPPNWNNPSKDKSQILQNDLVNFSASWSDNIRLKKYIFSINQGSSWTNYSEKNLSGTFGISSERIQISASGGTLVKWLFYAEDSAGNRNITDTLNFTVISVSTSTSTSTTSATETTTSTAAASPVSKQIQKIKNFKIEPLGSFKIETLQGQNNIVIIKITNTGNQNINFTVKLKGLEEFYTSISEEEFKLAEKESKSILIEVTPDKFLTPDIYFGEVIINGEGIIVRIPIVIQVNPLNANFDLKLQILNKNKKVLAGKEVIANITFENLEDIAAQKVTLYYAISDLAGNIIDSNQEELNFNQKKLTLLRNLTTLKENAPNEYIFYARAIIDNKVVLASDEFEIGERFNLAAFIKLNLLYIIAFMLLVSILIFIIRYKRNKERLRLLNLYLMINEMKSYLKDNNIEKAINTYIKIKSVYGEPISKTTLENKESLKKEMQSLIEKTNNLQLEIAKRTDDKNQVKNEEISSKKEKQTSQKENKKEINETDESNKKENETIVKDEKVPKNKEINETKKKTKK